MEIVLSERTNRKDKYEVLKNLMEEIKEKYSKTDVEIKNLFFNKDGWLIIDVSEEKFFINTINKFTIFPLTIFNKQFLITGKIEEIENDYLKIIFPNDKGETSTLDIKIKNFIRKIGISTMDLDTSLKELLHIKKLSPIHIYLGREKNISYYHANIINEWYKKGLSAVNVNDVTMRELKNIISENIQRGKIEFDIFIENLNNFDLLKVDYSILEEYFNLISDICDRYKIQKNIQ